MTISFYIVNSFVAKHCTKNFFFMNIYMYNKNFFKSLFIKLYISGLLLCGILFFYLFAKISLSFNLALNSSIILMLYL